MKIFLDGYNYMVQDMTGDDVKVLKKMIKNAAPNERKVFENLCSQIDELEKNSLL